MNEMNNFSSPFAGLMLSDPTEDADTPNSLLDLINSHNSFDQNFSNEISSLSDLTLNFLNVDSNTPPEKDDSLLPSSFSSLTIVGDAKDRKSDEYNTLEAYTKSYLNSKGTSNSPLRKPAPPANFSGRISKIETDVNVKQLNEKFQNIRVNVSEKVEARKIDLTAALTNRTKTNSISLSTEVPVEPKQSIFSYPVQECNIDLSSLANENLLYKSTSLSPFGYVVSRKWNHITFPKKYRKLGNLKPYNVSRAFKFDTPSPDDCALKNRTRNISVGDTKENSC